MGLLDALMNKEKKLLERSRKELAKVDSLEKAGRSDDALAELEKLRLMLKENILFIGKMKWEFSQVFSSMGMKYLAFVKAQPAHDAAKRSLEFDPKNAEAMGVAGRAALALGMKDEAVASLKNAVATAPQSEDLWVALGETQNAVGDASGAIGSYTKALTINPLGIRTYDKILEHTPDDVDLIKRKASTLTKLQRYDDAAKTYQDGIEINKNDKELWVGRATALNFAARARRRSGP